MKFWQKTISTIATFALIYNSLAAPLSVLAQEITPSPTPTSSPQPTTEATAQPTASPTPTDTATATPTPEATITPDPSASPTVTPSSTIIDTATPTPTATATPDPTLTATPTPSPWTFENVALNQEYTDPQTGVKITFTKLPNTSGNIKIEEITLTSDQIKQTGSLSDKAYDITSDMQDGTFAYNLVLPIPDSSKGKTVDVKFAENASQLSSAQVAGGATTTDNSVSVNNLNHFTIFVVVDDGDSGYSDNGWNNYTSAGYNGDHHWVTPSQAGKIATWTFTGTAGEYAILPSWVIWTDHATNAHYTSSNIAGFNLTGINQKLAANSSITEKSDGTWSGWYPNTERYNLTSGNTVTLSVESSTDGNLAADAMAFVGLSEIYVNQSWTGDAIGKDLGEGKIFGINAFSKIQDGIKAVSSGGTVYVAAGTYQESLIINSKSDLTIKSTDGAATTIIQSRQTTGVVQGIHVTNSTGITIDGFTIENVIRNTSGDIYTGATGQPYAMAAVLLTDSSNCIIKNNILFDFWYGAMVDGETATIPDKSSGNVIEDNTIDGNNVAKIGVYVYDVVGSRTDNITVSGNIIKNSYYGIYINANAENLQILDNTITGSNDIMFSYGGYPDYNYFPSPVAQDNGDGISFGWSAYNVLVQGNTISNFQNGIYVWDQAGDPTTETTLATVSSNSITGNVATVS